MAYLSVKMNVHIFSQPQFMADLRAAVHRTLESLATDRSKTNTLREMYSCFLKMEGAPDPKLEELIFQRLETTDDPVGGILFVQSLLIENG